MKWLVSYIIVVTLMQGTHGQKTFLDSVALRPLFRFMRNLHFRALSYQSDEEIIRICRKNNLLQRQYDERQHFFCDTRIGGRSKEVPTSVHKLRPGDIDIIASMGDSLTAGVGALATDIMQLTLEYKGVSFSIGGEKDWRTFLTIPNILKEFNENLYGYSTGLRSLSIHKQARFNVAELGAISRDTPHMAEVLIQRMRADERVDIENHWKFITFLIGANDFCLDMCYQNPPEKIVKMHEENLLQTLRILRDNLPRTMVNILHAPNVMLLLTFKKKKPECETFHHFECPCVFGSRFQSQQKRYVKIIEEWKRTTEEVINRDEFNTLTFTVNLQGFVTNLDLPTTPDGSATDFTYMSQDCFHLSQKGYALATNALWNNLFERNGNKTENWNWKEDFKFKCPTEENPYIFTRDNS